jgi:DNA-binding NtrC family response regulator
VGIDMLKGVRVLLVDDEEPFLEIVCEILTMDGLIADVASNAPRALQMLEDANAPYSLLMTDVNLTEISGIDLAVKARQRKPDLKVIFITGTSNAPFPKDSLVLHKPFKRRELMEMISTALGIEL